MDIMFPLLTVALCLMYITKTYQNEGVFVKVWFGLVLTFSGTHCIFEKVLGPCPPRPFLKIVK